jgi:YD repeat-containing protein
VYNTNASGPKGAQLVYPNYQHVASGAIASFWHYDPDGRDWYRYGWGTVKTAQVFPSPDTRLYSFTGAMINTGQTPSATPGSPEPQTDGDPIDLATGLFTLEKTDLYLPDVLPLALHRTYRPADPATRSFGIGMTHDYAMFLWSAHQYTEADLILPNQARIHYVRTSPGTLFEDAVFEHTSSPTRFYKSTIRWNGNGWDLTLKDGTVYVFGNEAPLQAIRDRYGNQITISWSGTFLGSGAGQITRLTSPNGRWIAFTYDGSNRVTQATDNIGRTVGYQYDASGRLWKVTDPVGGVTTYTYDASNRMTTITDARHITYLTNQYDANDRVTLGYLLLLANGISGEMWNQAHGWKCFPLRVHPLPAHPRWWIAGYLSAAAALQFGSAWILTSRLDNRFQFWRRYAVRVVILLGGCLVAAVSGRLIVMALLDAGAI